MWHTGFTRGGHTSKCLVLTQLAGCPRTGCLLGCVWAYMCAGLNCAIHACDSLQTRKWAIASAAVVTHGSAEDIVSGARVRGEGCTHAAGFAARRAMTCSELEDRNLVTYMVSQPSSAPCDVMHAVHHACMLSQDFVSQSYACQAWLYL